MKPNEVERTPLEAAGLAEKKIGIANVDALPNVGRYAIDGQFAAHVAACAAAGHRVEDISRLEKPQQVLDEVAAAIAGIATVAEIIGVVEVVKASQSRHRAGVDRDAGKLDINGLGGFGW